MSCVQLGILSVYYYLLDNINFDEDVDTIPSSSNESIRSEVLPHLQKLPAKVEQPKRTTN